MLVLVPQPFTLKSMLRHRCRVLVVFIWCIRLLFPLISTCFLHNNERNEKGMLLNCASSRSQHNRFYLARCFVDDVGQTLRLPVFPLKKSVKLPTEEITLNLFEERYLEMAKFVLRQRPGPCFFGALYCAMKPQIVSAGMGPTTPIVELGDIGVIFLVEENEEGMIPALDGSLRRRIRLRGVAIGRFRIEAIIQNGYGSSSAPFILTEASKVEDEMIEAASKDDILVVDLQTKLRQKLGKSTEFKEERNFIKEREDEEDATLGSNSFDDRFASHDPQYQLSRDESSQDEPARNRYRQEMFSFFALAQLKNGNTAPLNMLKYLQCVSTKERLLFANHLQNTKESIWRFPF